MIDLFSDEIRRNPYPIYSQIRSSSPVLHEPRSDLWTLFDYDSVRRALTDHDSFSSDLTATADHRTPQWLIFFDPPRHTRMRALITRALSPQVVAGLEPRIRQLSRDLLDRVIARGEMDLAADFSIPLPMRVIAEMIGIPAADWPRFRRWSDGILKLSYVTPASAASENTATEREEMAAAISEFRATEAEIREYLPELIAQRKAEPRDDLLTRLVVAEVDGERLTQEEILGFFELLLVGGNETTTNLINNAILCLVENPDQRALLEAAPNLLPSAIEEVLRYRSPLQWTFRATRREVELHGQTIPAGKLVLVLMGSANRDPNQFTDAERFDITRHPNPHVAFGHGIHFCLGAALSRLESRIALSELLERVKDFSLASDAPWEPRKALHVLGPNRLPIRFTPGKPTASE